MATRRFHDNQEEALQRQERRLYAWLVLIALFVVLYAMQSRGVLAGLVPQFIKDDNLSLPDVLFGGIALVGAIYAIYLHQTDIKCTLREFRESNYLAHYAELDRIYLELLKLTVEHPHLRATDGARDAAQVRQYDSYAYMVWNFIETVADRLWPQDFVEPPSRVVSPPSTPRAFAGRTRRAWQWIRNRLPGASDPPSGSSSASDQPEDLMGKLRATWGSAIDEEMRIHRDWWFATAIGAEARPGRRNFHKFKDPMYQWVERRYGEIDRQDREPTAAARIIAAS